MIRDKKCEVEFMMIRWAWIFYDIQGLVDCELVAAYLKFSAIKF